MDGLTLWLDGINKGNSAGNWKDLIGGEVFVPNGPTSADKGWVFDGVDDYMENTTLDTMDAAQITYEAVFRRDNTSVYSTIFGIKGTGSKRPHLCYGSGNTVRFATSGWRGYNKTNAAGVGVHSWTCSKGVIYHKGALVDYITSGYFSNGDATLIGARISGGEYGYFFNGTMYSLRIYNRALTADEVAHNWQIDRKRFNF